MWSSFGCSTAATVSDSPAPSAARLLPFCACRIKARADGLSSYRRIFRHRHCAHGEGRVPQESQTDGALPRCASHLLP